MLPNAQAGVGLRSSAPTLQNSQTENLSLRAGSGEDTSFQNNGGSITGVIRDLCTLISKQNEAQNARISQQDARIRQQNESQNNMIRECLTRITNVVRENSPSVNQCINGIKEQLSNLTRLIQSPCRQACTREVTQVGLHENSARCDTVTSVESCQSTNTVASNGFLHSDNSNGHSESVHTEPRYCHIDRRDNLPAMHVSPESQTYARHAGQNDSSMPIPGNLCGPSDAPVVQTDGRVAVPRLATSDAHHTVSNPSESNVRNMDIAGNTSGPHDAFSRNGGVKLPVFSGNSNESWKVWYSRFSTVANLKNWDDSTRLNELVQRLHGTAAEFVFDEIPSEIIGNFQSLVHELSLRFQTVETNRTFRAQFGKRTQRIGESVEDYCAELKRIYDKAYPGRNPEMRQQLLLQQFLNGLRNKQAKFAVEYFKEPCTIEDAVHHVVTYMEAQQGTMCNDRSTDRRSKSVIFKADTVTYEGDDERNEEENQKRDSLIASPSGTREQHTIRKVQTMSSNSDSAMLSHILQCVTAIAERERHESKSNKTQVTPRSQDQLSSHDQLRPQNQNKGQTHGQGQMRPNQQGQCQSAGQNRLTNVQCFYCANFGNFKRDCPFLQVQQKLNGNSEPPGTEPQETQRTPLGGQIQGSSLNTGSDIESRQAVPQLKSQNVANLNVSEFNHETMVRRVSTLVSTRNSKILSRHDVRSPVRSCKTTTPNSVSKDRLSISSSGSKINAHQDSLEIFCFSQNE